MEKGKSLARDSWQFMITLYIINNPAENLNVEEKVEVVRFLVPEEEWKGKGVKA